MEHGEVEKRRRSRDDWKDLVAKGWVKITNVPKHGRAEKKAKKRNHRLQRHTNHDRVREELQALPEESGFEEILRLSPKDLPLIPLYDEKERDGS